MTRYAPLVLSALTVAICTIAAGQPLDVKSAPSTPEKAQIQASMDFISKLPAFSTDMEMKFELADKAGQSRDGAIKGTLDFSGQDKLRFRVEMDDGSMELFYTPDEKYLYISNENQYVSGTNFGNRQRALTLMPSREFSPAQIMLSDFLHGDPSLLSSMESTSLINDGPDSPIHIQTSGDGVTADFWIQGGEQPFLDKLQLDLLKMAADRNPNLAKVLVTYTFSNWNAAPEFAADHFNFKKPEGATEFNPSAQGPEDPLKGKPAPAIKLSMLGEGTLDLATHLGKDVVILDFWASWCGPCRKGLPIISEVAEQFKDKNVVFYAVNVGEPAEVAQGFLTQTGLSIPVALDLNREAQQKYQANSIPKTVIVAKDGTVYEVHLGVTPTLKEDLTKTLTELTSR